MPRPIRNNQPHGDNTPDTLQRYAADKLRIVLDPKTPAALDDESRLSIDAAALVVRSVEAYCPQHTVKLRAILRDMLAMQIKFNTTF